MNATATSSSAVSALELYINDFDGTHAQAKVKSFGSSMALSRSKSSKKAVSDIEVEHFLSELEQHRTFRSHYLKQMSRSMIAECDTDELLIENADDEEDYDDEDLSFSRRCRSFENCSKVNVSRVLHGRINQSQTASSVDHAPTSSRHHSPSTVLRPKAVHSFPPTHQFHQPIQQEYPSFSAFESDSPPRKSPESDVPAGLPEEADGTAFEQHQLRQSSSPVASVLSRTSPAKRLELLSVGIDDDGDDGDRLETERFANQLKQVQRMRRAKLATMNKIFQEDTGRRSAGGFDSGGGFNNTGGRRSSGFDSTGGGIPPLTSEASYRHTGKPAATGKQQGDNSTGSRAVRSSKERIFSIGIGTSENDAINNAAGGGNVDDFVDVTVRSPVGRKSRRYRYASLLI